jgi:arsenate reductase
VWPGHPITAHWGIPDPATAVGTPEEVQRAFRDAYFLLQRRIELFLMLPIKSIDTLALQREVDHIGQQ